jgi:hypothetical protein
MNSLFLYPLKGLERPWVSICREEEEKKKEEEEEKKKKKKKKKKEKKKEEEEEEEKRVPFVNNVLFVGCVLSVSTN